MSKKSSKNQNTKRRLTSLSLIALTLIVITACAQSAEPQERPATSVVDPTPKPHTPLERENVTSDPGPTLAPAPTLAAGTAQSTLVPTPSTTIGPVVTPPSDTTPQSDTPTPSAKDHPEPTPQSHRHQAPTPAPQEIVTSDSTATTVPQQNVPPAPTLARRTCLCLT